MKKRWILWPLASLVISLLLAACAAKATPTPTPTRIPPTSTPRPPTPTATAIPGATSTATTILPTPTHIPAAAATPENVVVVALYEKSASGQSGVAVLTARGDDTEIVINISPGASGESQPMHIHNGSCAALGSIARPLSSVYNGYSTTLLNVPLASLTTGGLAINLHKSIQEIATYTACGDIPSVPQGALTPTPTPTQTAAPTPIPPALTPTPASTTVSADIQNFTLPNLTVTVGTTVVWTNRDSASHTSTGVGGKWQSGNLAQGQSFSYTFREIGTFDYFCENHANMKGKVTVTLASGDYEY